MASRIKICKEAGCHNSQTASGYCRLHYLRHWKQIKKEAQERGAKRLNRYIDAVYKKHPTKYVEVIKEEIASGRFNHDDGTFNEVDELYRMFNEPTYEEDVKKLIKDLKIEKDF